MLVNFSDGTELRIKSTLLSKIGHAIDQSRNKCELGGILVGTQSIDGLAYEITDITVPGRWERRYYALFIRAKLSANRRIKKLWRQSSGKKNYLGEWHTHDELQPVPSSADKQAMRHIIEDNSMPFGRVFLVIFGKANSAFVEMISLNGERVFIEERLVRWRE